jgi:hypothetical protein
MREPEGERITLLTRQNHAAGHHNDANVWPTSAFMYVSESHKPGDEQTPEIF